MSHKFDAIGERHRESRLLRRERFVSNHSVERTHLRSTLQKGHLACAAPPHAQQSVVGRGSILLHNGVIDTLASAHATMGRVELRTRYAKMVGIDSVVGSRFSSERPSWNCVRRR
jgi:hypothetical protein